MKRDLLDIYRTGAEFLERHPTIQAIHTLFGRVIENMPTRRRRNRSGVGRAPGATDDDIRRGVAFLYCGSALFVIIALIFGFFPFGLMALFLYAFGIAVSKSLKYPYIPKTEGEPVKQSVMPALPPTSSETLSPKKVEKTLFWKIYGYINTLCIWGWIYLSLAQPKALKEWIIQNGIMEYIPHEPKVISKWSEVELLIGGIVVISIGFAILRLVLKFVLFVLQKSPKRDIREL